MNQTFEFSQDDVMQRIEAGNRFLQNHMTLEDAWTIHSSAKRLLAVAQHGEYSLPCVNACAQMMVRVEQRLGQIVDLIEASDPDAIHYGPATVRSLKIGKRDITSWKQLAEISGSDLDRYFSIISESGETISAKKVLTERAEDPLLMITDSIRGMAECGDEEGAHAAIQSVQSLLESEPKPVVHEPMPKDFSKEDVFRARGMGISLRRDDRQN